MNLILTGYPPISEMGTGIARVMLLTLLLSTSVVHTIVGYDCGSNRSNITTISLLEVGDCESAQPEVQTTDTYIQLIQFSGTTRIKIYQCKIEIKRTVYYCGMHSHISVVANGEGEYLQEITHETCKSIHATGAFKAGPNLILNNLVVNHSMVHSVTFAGNIGSNGECSGTQYADPFGTWNYVVVQGIIKIRLFQQEATVDLKVHRIKLKSGLTCPLSQTSCIDEEGGYSFWDPLPKDICHFREYELLYQGEATKIQDNSTNEILYSLTTQDITFILAEKGKFSICQYILARTEHPKLFIFETRQGHTFLYDNGPSVQNMDIFTYVNSKYIYVERHIRIEVNRLYRDLLYHRCTLEREVFKNALTLATQAPDEFAFNLMKGPGYMSVVAGEVVHIVKCVPVK